ncbi:Maf family protein [Marinobacter zhanjiangensis]|uniref:7-methyl-GTP pyrophosphatase n=1 Tax=Marinobacter zhanjiangensis TaxID=578215 RepID=A0ABQ3AS43_9GAMM|nr:Maf family nucleotide pyrophosphatase [Marinobacter zhanjiangensis]GGY64344.1 Maf-like protein YceF [Marinobacter zhanjiangensis]
MPDNPPLVLASSSPWRRQLLQRLRLPFECASPDIDETPQNGEAAPALVQRLASTKATALTDRFPNHLIIGSDQVATLGDTILGKPGNHGKACQQLALCSGRTVTFHAGLAVHYSASGDTDVMEEIFQVHFRHLSNADIDRYLRIEQPYQCAGSFQMEGLGIVLFERLEGRDPNALIGLPLIALTDMLARRGLDILARVTAG